MNMSKVLTRIKLKLGLLNIATPIEDLDGTIKDIITDITVPVFSIYSPCREVLTINTSDLELLDKQSDYEKYLLPDFVNRNLLYVIDVTYDTSNLSGLGYYTSGLPLLSGGLLHQVALSNAGAQVMNQIIPKMTFKFERPRVLYLYNSIATSKVRIELGFEHDATLASIPETARESFMELALLDVKENLYPTLKQYTEISTAYGNINLKIDDWQNAENDRKELINRWDDSYHLDFKPMYYI